MAKNRTFEITLQLADISQLFQKLEISPLSEDYQVYSYIAGIECLANDLYANPSPEAVKLTVLLPAEKITHELEAKVKAGVARYCQGRLCDVGHDLHATYWRGVRALLVAFVALFVFIGAAKLVYSENSLFLQIISEGLSVAGWVALWFPLETLTFKVWEHRLDCKIYTLLAEMEITISPVE